MKDSWFDRNLEWLAMPIVVGVILLLLFGIPPVFWVYSKWASYWGM